MNALIIVAGGHGSRMGSAVPKQFLLLGGKPVLMHTIEAFRRFDPSLPIILALPAEEHQRWADLCALYNFPTDTLTIVAGGKSRFHSVQAALEAVPREATLIGVHDGVRPLVPVEVITACFEEASHTGAAVPVCEVVETLRHLPTGATVPRGDYRLVQTPQVFRADWLREAYGQPYDEVFTDDASVVETAGHSVALVPGSRRNIKLTTPTDMTFAQFLLQGMS